MEKIICFIVYGNNEDYYNSAKFSILNLLNFTNNTDISIIVLSEDITKFKNYPITTIKITEKQIKDWSLNGRYHFRIKNLGLQHVIKTLELSDNGKIIFFDVDIYFKKNPLKLFNLITNSQIVMYRDEGFICKKKRFKYYKNNLSNTTIQCENMGNYSMNTNAKMWGSAIMGLTKQMALDLLQNADSLMLCLLSKISEKKAHTIEQFSLSESVKESHKITEGSRYVSIYSTDRKKRYAQKQLKKFFDENNGSSIDLLVNRSLSINLKRSIVKIIKERF
jgi:heptosyltransferase-3